jgi:hypothetical protein
MTLPDVIQAVADVLSGLSLADQVLISPPAKLPDDRTFVVFADPGEATLAANQGRAGRAVYQADDDVIVNWFRRIARDAMTEAYPEALSVFLATRDAIFAAVKDGALGGTIFGFSGIQTQIFGPMDYWNADTAFGFQLALGCRHGTEAAA